MKAEAIITYEVSLSLFFAQLRIKNKMCGASRSTFYYHVVELSHDA